MLVGVIIIILEIHDVIKSQTRSQFLFDIDTENDLYQIDEKEIQKYKNEYHSARKEFKGVQE